VTRSSTASGPSEPDNAAPSARQHVFVTTHWSVVVAASASETTHAKAALEDLCTAYWYPLYAFVRRKGRSVHDAQDLTQGFFARLLEKDCLQAASEEKGRFRTFLLTAFKRFLANEWDREKARKRGGGKVMISLDTTIVDSRCLAEAASGLSADHVYDRRWALTLLDQVMGQLRGEFVKAGRAEDFEHLKTCLTAARGAIDYSEIAQALNASEAAARVAVHRLRRRFRKIFREAVAQTVDDAEEVESEMHHLLKALGG